MHSSLCDEYGIDFPIFAFSHCRDVVAAVSKAGGMGVLGATRFAPDQLELELRWLDENCGGRPYGVDVLFAAAHQLGDEESLKRQIPQASLDFVNELTERFHIPPVKDVNAHSARGDAPIITEERTRAILEVAFNHPVRLYVSALGPAPADILERAHAQGAKVAGMVGTVRHARRHVDAGADLIIAVGTEAAGHTGEISTMVLTPQVVDAVKPIPVLAGGGIATGRQVAAALALGAEGVWTGSVWLTTLESDVEPPVMVKILAASSEDTVRSRSYSGKPIRQLRTAWTDAWEAPDAPPVLETPLQGLLVRDAIAAAYDHEVDEVIGGAAGQVIGMLDRVRPVRDVVHEMVMEYADAMERLVQLQPE